jgi:putative DNA primase/helicase
MSSSTNTPPARPAACWAAARQYAAMGLHIVPLRHRSPTGFCSCGKGQDCPENSRAKHPIMVGWQKQASADPAVINEWERKFTRANIGVLLGAKSGIIDVEYDTDEGRQTAERLLNGAQTPTYKSGSRSVHRLFQWRDDLPGGAVIHVAGLEIRTGNDKKGAQSVLPPSVHRTGKLYEWIIPPKQASPAPIPSALLALIANAAGEQEMKGHRGTAPQIGDRELALDALAGLNKNRAVGYDDWLEVGMALHSVDSSLLPAWDEWSQSCPEKYQAGACDEHWRSFTAGAGVGLGSLVYWAQGDGWIPPWQRNGRSKKSKKVPIKLPSAESLGGAPDISSPDGRTEIANARRLARKHGQNLRWCDPWDRFLVWDGCRWAVDHERRADALAKDIYQALWDEVALLAKTPDAGDELKDVLRYVRQTGTAHAIDAMLKLVRSEPGIAIVPAALDTDPWAYNVTNGTIDLRTGELRPHRHEDRITKLCPVARDPAADCPVWLRVLHDVTAGDVALQKYLRKAVGCSLTGDTREHALFFLYGSGENGKSTFISTVQAMMGPDYAMKAPPDLLMVKGNDAHPTERADLAGKRFVACVEASEGKRLAESLVKELTGGDKVRARRMREDFWEFDPTHKVWLAANHKPVIRGTDWGIWRRIKLIPFNVAIPPEKKDTALQGKLRAELPGILNWALLGCVEWQAEGLGEPQAVSAATSRYRRQQDVLAGFLDECCIVASDARARAGDLLTAYRKWSGDDRMSQRRLGEALTERGFDTAVVAGYTWRLGIGLTEDHDSNVS